MFKLLSTLALVSATVFPIDAAKAAYNWQSYVGDRACLYLRQGMSGYTAGYRAGEDILSSKFRSSFLRAAGSLSQQQMSSIVANQILTKCPNAVSY